MQVETYPPPQLKGSLVCNKVVVLNKSIFQTALSLCMLGSFAWFNCLYRFLKNYFSKKKKNIREYPLDPLDTFSGLILVQAVCKGYHPTTSHHKLIMS